MSILNLQGAPRNWQRSHINVTEDLSDMPDNGSEGFLGKSKQIGSKVEQGDETPNTGVTIGLGIEPHF